jgi:hypothetical protein
MKEKNAGGFLYRVRREDDLLSVTGSCGDLYSPVRSHVRRSRNYIMPRTLCTLAVAGTNLHDKQYCHAGRKTHKFSDR